MKKEGGALGDVNRVTGACWRAALYGFVRRTSSKENALTHCLQPSSLRHGRWAANKKRKHCVVKPVSRPPKGEESLEGAGSFLQ